nr:hypothetical protein [Tanacetum cinerariifolium]
MWSKVPTLGGLDNIPPRFHDVVEFLILSFKGSLAINIIVRLLLEATCYFIWAGPEFLDALSEPIKYAPSKCYKRTPRYLLRFVTKLSMEEEEVPLVDDVFEGALGALVALEMEALVDVMDVDNG